MELKVQSSHGRCHANGYAHRFEDEAEVDGNQLFLMPCVLGLGLEETRGQRVKKQMQSDCTFKPACFIPAFI